MAESRDAQVILKLYELMLWTLNHTARFPKHHRYSLGLKIEATLFDLLDVLIEARYGGWPGAVGAKEQRPRYVIYF